MRDLVTFGRTRMRLAVCQLLTAMMLFAQAIGLAQACAVATHSPAMAFARTHHHDGECGKTVNRNACLQQCTAGDQSSAHAEVAVAPMPMTPVLTLAATPDRGACLPVVVTTRPHSPDPPASIRFCSFQL